MDGSAASAACTSAAVALYGSAVVVSAPNWSLKVPPVGGPVTSPVFGVWVMPVELKPTVKAVVDTIAMGRLPLIASMPPVPATPEMVT